MASATKLFTSSDTRASFNAVAGSRESTLRDEYHDGKGVHDIHVNDPVFVKKGYTSQSMVHGVVAATKNRCVVFSNMSDVYREAKEEYERNSAKLTKEQFKVLKEGNIENVANISLQIQLRQVLNKMCQYVGFALGEAKVPSGKEAFAKQDGQLAVNRGGSVTIQADERITTGDYVVVDFDFKDFASLFLGDNDELFTRPQNCERQMKLKVKSFKESAAKYVEMVSTLYKGNWKAGDKRSLSVGLVDILCAGAPVVIGQCKSGCTKECEYIDVKLESHIAKSHMSVDLKGAEVDPSKYTTDIEIRKTFKVAAGNPAMASIAHVATAPTMASARITTTDRPAAPARDRTPTAKRPKKSAQPPK